MSVHRLIFSSPFQEKGFYIGTGAGQPGAAGGDGGEQLEQHPRAELQHGAGRHVRLPQDHAAGQGGMGVRVTISKVVLVHKNIS